MTKRCSKCRVTKQLSDFHKSKASGDGHNNRCKPCAKAAATEWAKANPERRAAIGKKWAANNPEKRRAYCAANSAKIIARVKKWRADNPEKFALHKPTRRAYLMKWRIANRAAIDTWNEENKWAMRSRVAKRRARRMQATPTWADAKAIQSFYISADALNMLTGEWHHVDHIVPLQGKTVCGLHNQFNLQILTATENRLKSNRHSPG